MTRGQALDEVAGPLPPGLTRIYGPDRQFLGLAEVTGSGRIVPRRLRPSSQGNGLVEKTGIYRVIAAYRRPQVR